MDEINLLFHYSPTFFTESEPQKLVARLHTSLIKYFTFLYVNQKSGKGSCLSLTGAIQNLDMQMESRRKDNVNPHHTNFQYTLPFNTKVEVIWNDSKSNVNYGILIQIKIPERIGRDSENSESANSGTTSVIREVLGSPTTRMSLKFTPFISIRDFESLCNEATEFQYQANRQNETMIKVFIGSEDLGCWELLNTRRKRPWSSIALPRKIKEDFLKDLETFIAGRNFYETHGLRYKRIYLLNGPSGTGKSSLIEAVAGKLNFNLCYLNLSSQMDNSRLCRLMADLKKDSIVVIEDIDSLGVAQEERDQNQTAITYSYILNLLDGGLYVDGMILVMTCNNRKKLGEALTRFSRIDRIYNFDAIQEEEIRQLFYTFLPSSLHSQCNTFIETVKYKSELTASLLQEFFLRIKQEYPDGLDNKGQILSLHKTETTKLKELIKSHEKALDEYQKKLYGE